MNTKNLMTPGELWFRVGFAALLIIVGLILRSPIGALLIIVGMISAIWTAVRAVRQVKAAERLREERNAQR